MSPTGSGKSFILAEALSRLPGAILTVPSVEIGIGIARKTTGGESVDWASLSEAQVEKTLRAFSIWTVKTFHNRLLQGKVDPPPYLLHDEAHHSVDNTHDVVHAACGFCPRAGLTATAYRGTPDETAKLRKAWGEPWVSLKLKEAVKQCIVARPDFTVWPLVNDDLISVSNGEFSVSSTDKAVEEALPAIIERLRAFYDDKTEHRWLRTTMVRVGSVNAARIVTHAMRDAGLPAISITGSFVDNGIDDAESSRQKAFERILSRTHALVQVRVVGEGVDLPMRVMIDLCPTLSPVLWMQAVGRITRPTKDEAPPLYVCTNHNLTRHAYLWEGLIPPAVIRDAQKAWGENYRPKRVSLARALNLEGFGRFAVSQVPLADGSYASLYALQTKDGMHLYAVLLHPCMEEPWYFEKTNVSTGEKASFRRGEHEIEYVKKIYGPWKQIEMIPSAEGYVSVKPGFLTDSQREYWASAAKRVGLDPDAEIDARTFQALPILHNTKKRFSFTTEG